MTDHPLVARSEPMPAHGGSIEGGQPLAGHLGLPSLLVREAVQNSWDARDDRRGEAPVRFEINGWDLDGDELDGLRKLLPVSHLEGFTRRSEGSAALGILHPNAALARMSLRVLVITDRRTVGLCGPSRSGLEWTPVRGGQPLARGQQRFANFVRNMGRASADIGGGDGGAYGVGKSALWMASECGTVLIHSRTTDENGEPVERFIGSVHGDHFYSQGREYTGRHFIGIEADDGVVEPLVGARAAAAAGALPLPTYSPDGDAVDGTSIVIVAPRFHLDWETEMKRLRDAVRWQVWPKRVPLVRSETSGPDMDIRLAWNNHPVEIPDPLEDVEIRPYAKALLDSARDRNSDEEARDMVVQCHKPKKRLGTVKFRWAGHPDDNVFHLTLTEGDLTQSSSADDVASEVIDAEPVVDFGVPWGQIALVRREPLLLVKYEPIGGPEEAKQVVGVFLSADDPDVEEALTKAEPPAHDDWIHKIVPKDSRTDHRRTFAKRTVAEIKNARVTFLARFRVSGAGHVGGGEQHVSRRISDGLLGGLGGRKAPSSSSSSSGGARARPHAQLDVVATYQIGDDTRHEVDVIIKGVGDTPTDLVLTAGGAARDNMGSIPVDGLVSYSWDTTGDGQLRKGESASITGLDNTRVTLVVQIASDLRFRPKVDVEVSDAC